MMELESEEVEKGGEALRKSLKIVASTNGGFRREVEALLQASLLLSIVGSEVINKILSSSWSSVVCEESTSCLLLLLVVTLVLAAVSLIIVSSSESYAGVTICSTTGDCFVLIGKINALHGEPVVGLNSSKQMSVLDKLAPTILLLFVLQMRRLL